MSSTSSLKKSTTRIFSVLLGSIIHAITINVFMNAAGIIPGGFVGTSLLVQKIFLKYFGINISYAALNITLNSLPAIFAFFYLGKRFVLYSIMFIVSSSLLVDLIPMYHLTDDIFLNVTFGGIIYGFGASLVLNSNACTGGTDFLAMIISHKTNKSIWNYVLVYNILIYVVYGSLFEFKMALYSIVFQVIYTAMINLGQTRYQRRTAFIVTQNPEPLADELMEITGHGVTVIEAKGQYTGEKRYLLYMVISKKDVRLIREHIAHNHHGAFLNITDSEQLIGKFVLEPID